jgi:hypothetical protein
VVEPKASPFGRHAWGRPKTKVAAGLVSEEQRFDFRGSRHRCRSFGAGNRRVSGLFGV